MLAYEQFCTFTVVYTKLLAGGYMHTNGTWQYILTNPIAESHIVQVCQNETFRENIVTNYIKDGLLNDEAVIVVAGPTLRKAVISKLDAQNFDVQNLKNQGQIKFLDAEFLLSSFLIDGVLEEQSFQQSIEVPIQAARVEYGKVRIFGEMVDVLWKKAQYDAAIQLENLWSNLSQKQEFLFLCTYSLDSIDSSTYDESLERICSYHTHLIPVENYGLIETGVGEAVLDVFGDAWNRVIGKLAESRKISTQLSASPTALN